MATELDPRLEVCWLIVERDRDSYSPSFRKFLDKVFLKRFAKCKRSPFEIQKLKVDLKILAQAIDDIRYVKPQQLSEHTFSVGIYYKPELNLTSSEVEASHC